RLRITGTVRDDIALGAFSDPSEITHSPHSVPRLIDVSDQFYDRQRQLGGECNSVLEGDYDQRDDTEAINDYADQLLQLAGSGQLVARISIPWLATGYQIGDVIRDVSGREINLERDTGSGRLLQVIGIEFTNETSQQRTELI